MSRKCKCQITGEIGTTDTFVKINGKYYKSQEVYDQHKTNIELYKKIVNIIAEEFLNYDRNQVFPTLLTKKLKELEFYPNEVILKTVEKNYETIKYWMNVKDFSNDVGRISYIFAIIKNNINDVYKKWKTENEKHKTIDNTIKNITDINIDVINNNPQQKDLRKWLEEDEWN